MGHPSVRVIVNAISANTGGIVTYTTNLIEHIGARGAEVEIHVPGSFNPASVSHENVKVVPSQRRFYGPVHRFLWEQFGWRRIVKKSGADILFSSANYGILAPPIPQVLLVQGEIYLNPIYREKVLPTLSLGERLSAFLRRYLMLLSARFSRVVIFPSQVAMDAAIAFDRKLADNAVVNYLGVSRRFKVPKERRQWRSDGSVRLLYVSVYYPHKDPLTLAAATMLLNQTGMPTQTRITMEPVDFDPWGAAAWELDALRDSKFDGCLEMGRIAHADLADALKQYDAFVFPSMAETFGFPMAEAMEAGIPLVVSDIPVHREICGDAALYFELGDPSSLADCVRRLDADPALRERLISAGQKRAEEKFTWQNHVAVLLQSFEDVAPSRRFRVLINALHARTGGGVTYLHNMLPLMAANERLDVHICMHEDQEDVLPSHLDGITYHLKNFRRGFWRVLVREQFDIPRLARRLNVDATFSPANYGPILAPNHVIMIRNAVNVGFIERRPVKLGYWALLYFATLISLLTSKSAVAVSEYAKNVIVGAFLGTLGERISVVPHGVDDAYRRGVDDAYRRGVDDAYRMVAPDVGDEGFLLAVSDIYVQKNFTNLLKALVILRWDFPDIRLKIAGKPVDADYFDGLKRFIKAQDLDANVEFLGHVTSDALRDLYVGCRVFVFPSTVETFGNPLVEAMACGAAIACSNTAAMPEVLGDAGQYFDPHNPEQIAVCIRRLMTDETRRREMSRRATERAALYSWRQTERKTVSVLMGR